MQQAIQGERICSDDEIRPPSESEIFRKNLVTKVIDLLDPRFHHPHVPVNESILKRLHVMELALLQNFLTGNVAKPQNPLQRPPCPITNPRQHTLARFDYKNAMVEYIAGFGYRFFNKNPCYYLPSFLEALANYCEYKAGVSNDSSES